MSRTSSSRPVRAAQGAPAVRAKLLQHWVALAERHDAALTARIAKHLSDDKRQSILSAAALDWLPIELDVEVIDAVAQAMGAARFSAFARAYFLEVMPRQPLAGLLELGTKLMGLSPESFLRWWGKGWDAIYRDCGTVRSSLEAPYRGRVVHQQVPAVCLRSEAFVEALLGSAYGIYALAGTTGVVRVASIEPALGHLELQFEWRPRRASVTR